MDAAIDETLSQSIAFKQRRYFMADGEVMFTLTIPLGEGIGTPANPVSVQGPAVAGTGIRPEIFISRYRNGRFRFRVGVVGDSDPIEVPEGIRKWYDNLNRRAASGGRFHMPSCSVLSSMTYQGYELNRRVWHTGSIALNGEIWLYLPPDVFRALVNRCRQQAGQGR